jgi:hypothetical protein
MMEDHRRKARRITKGSAEGDSSEGGEVEVGVEKSLDHGGNGFE